MLPDLNILAALLREAATAELLPRFASVERQVKRDGSLITVADQAMQDRLQASLHARWPEYRLLGEEMESAEQAALLARPGLGLWILDPLDGTTNFAAGVPFFSVSLALMIGGQPVLGAIYDPLRDECFTARAGAGAWLNGEPLKHGDLGLTLRRAIAVVDFKRLPETLARRLAERPPYMSQRSFGSVALDWCWVAARRFHVYLHGRQKMWDYAAGCLILAEAGGTSCTLEGEPVFMATGESRSAIAALDGRLFTAWREWLEGREPERRR